MIQILLHTSSRISGYLFDNPSPRHDSEVTESRQESTKNTTTATEKLNNRQRSQFSVNLTVRLKH